jgi:hypothetical protein
MVRTARQLVVWVQWIHFCTVSGRTPEEALNCLSEMRAAARRRACYSVVVVDALVVVVLAVVEVALAVVEVPVVSLAVVEVVCAVPGPIVEVVSIGFEPKTPVAITTTTTTITRTTTAARASRRRRTCCFRRCARRRCSLTLGGGDMYGMMAV